MITVDMANPPRFVVLVDHEPCQTWQFGDATTALAAYRAAVQSGQFEHIVKRATRKRAAVTVSLVSIWRLRTETLIDGSVRKVYYQVDPDKIVFIAAAPEESGEVPV